MRIAEAFVEIRLDRSKAEADARGIAGDIGRKINDVFKAAVFVKGVNDSIQAASRLQQAVGATAAVFGKAGSTVDDFAATSASSFGISSAAARELTSALGAMLQGFGYTQDEAAKTSVSIAKLGADLAATFGGKPEEAVQALGAALRGEFDPLERFGISLTAARVAAKAVEMGLAESTAAVDGNAKAQATLALITEQSANAQGQFAREIDSAAGQAAIAAAKGENAAADFGENLLPIYSKAAEVVGFLADQFAALPGPVQAGVVALAGIVAFSGPISSFTGLVGDLVTALRRTGTTAATSATALGALSGVIALAGIAYTLWKESQEDSSIAADVFADALRESTSQLILNADAADDGTGKVIKFGSAMRSLSQAILKSLPDNDYGSRSDAIVAALGRLDLTADDTAAALIALGGSLGVGDDRFRDFVDGVDGLSVSQQILVKDLLRSNAGINEFKEAVSNRNPDNGVTFTADETSRALALLTLRINAADVDLQAIAQTYIDTARGANELSADLVAQAEAALEARGSVATSINVYDEYLRIVGALSPEQQKVALAFGDITDEAIRQGPVIEDLVDGNDFLTRAYADLSSELDRLDRALGMVFDRFQSQEDANQGVVEGLADLKTALKENGSTLDILTAKGRGNRDAVADQKDAILDLVSAMVENGASLEDATAAGNLYREQLRQTLIQAGLTEAEVDTYLTTLGFTPDSITTAVELTGTLLAQEQIEGLQGEIDKLPEEVQPRIQVILDTGDIAAVEAELRLLTSPNRWVATIGAETRNQQEGRGTGIEGLQRIQTVTDATGQTVAAKATDAESTTITEALARVEQARADAAAAKAAGDEEAERSALEAIEREDRVARNMYRTNALSLDAYRTYLQGRLAADELYSDDFARRVEDIAELTDKENRELERLRNESEDRKADDQKAAQEAEEQRTRDHLDRLAAIFKQAAAARAFDEAAFDTGLAVTDLEAARKKAALYALDKRRTPEERAQADADYQAAQDRAADLLERRARTGALAAGLEDGTEAFAQALRAALLGDAANAPDLADEIARILIGVPDLGAAEQGGLPSSGPFSGTSGRLGGLQQLTIQNYRQDLTPDDLNTLIRIARLS